MPTPTDSDRPVISRLSSGRTVWLAADGPFELVDGRWIPLKGVTVGEFTEGKPLADGEIAALRASGILPR